MNNKILYFSIFLLLTSFSKKANECDVKNESKIMLQSNSAELNYCIANKFKGIKNTIENSETIAIVIDISQDQYSTPELSEKLISFSVNNQLDTALKVNTQEYLIPFIQEALDSNGNWRPIEYWINWSCGNAYQQMNLESGESIRYPIRKYRGDFETKIRVKAKINNQIYYSTPFDGSIYLTQMDISYSEKNIKISRKNWKELKTDKQFSGMKRKDIKEGKAIPAAPDFLN